MIHAPRTSLVSLAFPLLMIGMAVTGCGPTAYKITPVPADRSLDESVLMDDGGWAPAKIALIDVDGIIMNGAKFSLLGEGENPVALFVEKLDKAARDSAVKGLILRINSPGGGVTASDLMYAELLNYKRRTKGSVPVVAVMMDVAASGGYYLACGTDRIVAHPTTVTGSIGVIMQMFNIRGTMGKIGVETIAITSGKMKDAGSPFKALGDEERRIFQGLVDQFYDRFVKVVAAGRPGLDEPRVRELADGRVYSAQQALELGFIDRIGSLRSAIDDLKEQIDAERVRVVTYHRPLGFKPNVYAEQPVGPPEVNLVQFQLGNGLPQSGPQFLYLWAPGL